MVHFDGFVEVEDPYASTGHFEDGDWIITVTDAYGNIIEISSDDVDDDD